MSEGGQEALGEPLAAIRPGQCQVCRRPEEGIGWRRKGAHHLSPITWLCKACIPLGGKVTRMPTTTKQRLELEAHQLACDDVAKWLAETTGPDLSKLSIEDFRDVFASYLDRFGHHIKERFNA